jgi:hypothetical protein
MGRDYTGGPGGVPAAGPAGEEPGLTRAGVGGPVQGEARQGQPVPGAPQVRADGDAAHQRVLTGHPELEPGGRAHGPRDDGTRTGLTLSLRQPCTLRS